METVNTRDRYGNTSFNTGLGEVPEYLQYKKKAIQNCVSAKRRVKQDIVTIPNVTAGTTIPIRINSQNWIDPQSLRVGFSFNFVGNPTTYAKFNDDTGVNGIVKSVKVSSNSKNLEFISNYNLLQKIQYSCSVSNDWKQAQGGMLEGFGSYLTSTSGVTSASNVVNGPPLKPAVSLATANTYSIALWTGMLGQCHRLLPNMLLNINIDLEFAPFLDFCVVDGGATSYQVNNVYIVYDEYVVSDLYRQVFEEAVRTKGISFDYNTITNSQQQISGNTTNISSTINDSAKQLLSVYTSIRPSDIATANFKQGKTGGTAGGLGAGVIGYQDATLAGYCTNLESVAGKKVISAQYKLGTTNYPEFPLTKLVDMYQMSLQAMNRANSLQLDMPLSYNKYVGPCRTFWLGCDFENSKSSDNSQYSGINTSGHSLQLNVSLSDVLGSPVDAGVVVPAVDNPAGAGAEVAGFGSNGGAPSSFFLVDFFLLHSRILSISPTGGVIIDY